VYFFILFFFLGERNVEGVMEDSSVEQVRFENALLCEQCSEVFNIHQPIKVYERRAGIYVEVPKDQLDQFKRDLSDKYIESQRTLNNLESQKSSQNP